jgi:hypothetical protein
MGALMASAMAGVMAGVMAGAMACATGRRGSHSTPLHYLYLTLVCRVVTSQDQAKTATRGLPIGLGR